MWSGGRDLFWLLKELCWKKFKLKAKIQMTFSDRKISILEFSLLFITRSDVQFSFPNR